MYIMYWYPKCSTCQKAKKYLETLGVDIKTIDIKTTPPSAEQIKQWMTDTDFPIKRFFNTSGQKYRELQLKDQVDQFDSQQAANLLATDGMLIKRPLLIKDDTLLAIGFKEEEYKKVCE